MSVRLDAVRELLSKNPTAKLRFLLPDGQTVPGHFHVTEVGKVRKDFIDCGGTRRTSERCVLQLWVAGDEDHQLDASKLARIIAMAGPILGEGADDLSVEVEYDVGVITQFPVAGIEASDAGPIVFRLEGKHTQCLAPDR